MDILAEKVVKCPLNQGGTKSGFYKYCLHTIWSVRTVRYTE